MNKQVTNKDNIIKLILEEQERLVTLGVVNIGLFGSFVRGDQNASSDIDFLVEFRPEKHTFDNFMEVNMLIFFFKIDPLLNDTEI